MFVEGIYPVSQVYTEVEVHLACSARGLCLLDPGPPKPSTRIPKPSNLELRGLLASRLAVSPSDFLKGLGFRV